MFIFAIYKIVCLHKFLALCRVATRPVFFQKKTLKVNIYLEILFKNSLCLFSQKIVCLHNLNFAYGGKSPVDEAYSFLNKARKV